MTDRPSPPPAIKHSELNINSGHILSSSAAVAINASTMTAAVQTQAANLLLLISSFVLMSFFISSFMDALRCLDPQSSDLVSSLPGTHPSSSPHSLKSIPQVTIP